MRLQIFKHSIMILDTPVQTEWEFFKLIFKLQMSITGTAHCQLVKDKCILHAVKLGERPSRVFNHALQKWFPFEEFFNNPYSFAYCDRMKYAFWIRDKLLVNEFF